MLAAASQTATHVHWAKKVRAIEEAHVGFFNRKESEEQMLKRLSKGAGNVIAMLKGVLRGPQGTDMTVVMIYAAGLAGCACHEAVKAEGGTFAVAKTTNGQTFYLGDDVNKYLLENRLSVLSFISAICEGAVDDALAYVTAFVSSLGDPNLSVCDMTADSVYKMVKECWDGIYVTMTTRICKKPSEWPVLYGIVLQNIMREALQIGAPADEVKRIALECSIALSRMGDDTFVTG